MNAQSQEQSSNRFMSLTGYLTIAAVGIAAVLESPTFWGRWGAVALLIALTLLQPRSPGNTTPQGRRKAEFFLGLQVLAVIGLLLTQPGSSIYPILFFVLSSIATQIGTLGKGIAWILLFTLITAVNFVGSNGWDEGLRGVAPYFGGYLFFGITANAMVRARQAQHQAEKLLAQLQNANARLEAANTELKAYANRIESMAVMDERSRMAREMHDTVGHRLTVAAVQLEGAQRLIPQDSARAAEMVGTVREQVREALGELRSTVARMREPLEAGMQLEPALERLVDSFGSATGLDIMLSLPEEMPLLPLLYRQSIFRAAQESLTNIQRHARATRAWIEVSLSEDEICLCVSDNGKGYPAENAAGAEPKESHAGFGLLGLRERAAQIGGRLALGERPGGGALLEFHLPLPREAGHA